MADAEIEDMRRRMTNAAQMDAENRREGKPAMHKLKMLPEVVSLLNRNQYVNSLVDPEINLLEAVKFFLEPLDDGSLPAYNIQRDLIGALGRLPINKEALIASGIGKVIVFYTRSKRPEPGIKRQAERLLAEWTRPILQRSDDYSKRVYQEAAFDPTYVACSTPPVLVLPVLTDFPENLLPEPNRRRRRLPKRGRANCSPRVWPTVRGPISPTPVIRWCRDRRWYRKASLRDLSVPAERIDSGKCGRARLRRPRTVGRGKDWIGDCVIRNIGVVEGRRSGVSFQNMGRIGMIALVFEHSMFIINFPEKNQVKKKKVDKKKTLPYWLVLLVLHVPSTEYGTTTKLQQTPKYGRQIPGRRHRALLVPSCLPFAV